MTAAPRKASREENGEEDFLSASPLAISGSAAKTLFRAPTIPQATQAKIEAPNWSRTRTLDYFGDDVPGRSERDFVAAGDISKSSMVIYHFNLVLNFDDSLLSKAFFVAKFMCFSMNVSCKIIKHVFESVILITMCFRPSSDMYPSNP